MRNNIQLLIQDTATAIPAAHLGLKALKDHRESPAVPVQQVRLEPQGQLA